MMILFVCHLTLTPPRQSFKQSESCKAYIALLYNLFLHVEYHLT